MSAAFDTINCNKLSRILDDIVHGVELKNIWFLLSNTEINMKKAEQPGENPPQQTLAHLKEMD